MDVMTVAPPVGRISIPLALAPTHDRIRYAPTVPLLGVTMIPAVPAVVPESLDHAILDIHPPGALI